MHDLVFGIYGGLINGEETELLRTSTVSLNKGSSLVTHYLVFLTVRGSL